MPENQNTKRQGSERYLGMLMIGIGLIMFAAIAGIVLINQGSTASTPQVGGLVPASVNFAAPELELKDLDGNPVALSDYRGKVVLINNWATWCPPCREEMPVLDAYHADHVDENFSIIAVDAGEPGADVRTYAASMELSFPVWLDPDMEAIQVFRNNGLPSSYVVNKDGMVVLAWNGAITREMLEKYVTPLLEN
jgi:thiol-disulfide isomerase/thioredoxin